MQVMSSKGIDQPRRTDIGVGVRRLFDHSLIAASRLQVATEVSSRLRQLGARLPCPFLHELVVPGLVVAAFLISPEAANARLMLDAFFRRHQLPAARVALARPPRSALLGWRGEGKQE